MKRALIWLGGIALLAATMIDTVAVIGRNAGFALHGAIELIQGAVLIAGGVALVIATLLASHARVHLLLDRLTEPRKALANRLCTAATALFLAAMLAGSIWLALDLWGSHEVSELLGLPWRWLRLFANLCLLAAIVLLLRQTFRRQR